MPWLNLESKCDILWNIQNPCCKILLKIQGNEIYYGLTHVERIISRGDNSAITGRGDNLVMEGRRVFTSRVYLWIIFIQIYKLLCFISG